MSANDCPRRWEMEALEDGRLTGADRAGFERHLAVCAACQRGLRALEALREAMGHLPVPTTTPMERLRMRATLLREVNDRVVSVQRLRGTRWMIAIAVLGASLVGALAIWRAPRKEIPPVALAAAAPKFDVENIRGAVWESRTHGSTTSVELVEGSASFSVPHLEPAQRFVVSLPDGEIEVRGTRFTVDVEVHETRRVAVLEGRVAFRRGGYGETLLVAGDHWSKAAEPPARDPLVESPSAPDAGALAAGGGRKSLAAPSAAAPARPLIPSAGERFDEAMGSFKAEDYTRAGAQFLQFTRQFPEDPRCEDASFLRAVARWRAGDKEDAARLARAYLSAYPNGLRRTEAQHLVDGTGH